LQLRPQATGQSESGKTRGGTEEASAIEQEEPPDTWTAPCYDWRETWRKTVAAGGSAAKILQVKNRRGTSRVIVGSILAGGKRDFLRRSKDQQLKDFR
jgi:hypothetical protein